MGMCGRLMLYAFGKPVSRLGSTELAPETVCASFCVICDRRRERTTSFSLPWFMGAAEAMCGIRCPFGKHA